MAGTKEGGAKTKATLKRRYGEGYYGKIGAIGGHKSRTGGFASEEIGSDGLTGKQRASVAGKRGGQTMAERKKAAKAA